MRGSIGLRYRPVVTLWVAIQRVLANAAKKLFRVIVVKVLTQEINPLRQVEKIIPEPERFFG